jgi:hypothetical protein
MLLFWDEMKSSLGFNWDGMDGSLLTPFVRLYPVTIGIVDWQQISVINLCRTVSHKQPKHAHLWEDRLLYIEVIASNLELSLTRFLRHWQ